MTLQQRITQLIKAWLDRTETKQKYLLALLDIAPSTLHHRLNNKPNKGWTMEEIEKLKNKKIIIITVR